MTLASGTLHQGGAVDADFRRSGRRQATGMGKSKRPFQPYHSINVPRRLDLESEFLTRKTSVTTIMLRNIPNRYTQSHLIEEIDGMGFAGRFDFFYLPMDVHNRTNVGYAFINFLTPADAHRFFSTFRDYMFQRHSSKKIASVSPAHVQGLANNLRNFLNKAVTQSRDTQYRPVVIINGIPRDISEALEELQEPKNVQRRWPMYHNESSCDGSVVAPAAPGAMPWESASWSEVGTAPWPVASSQKLPQHGIVHTAGSGAHAQRTQCHVPEAFLPTGPPVDQAVIPKFNVPPPEDQTHQASMFARQAFENAVFSWLQDSEPSQPVASFSSTTQCDSAGGSRTGTPRSTCSSLTGYKSCLAGELDFDCEGLTPRTDKKLLGQMFPTFSL